MRIGELAQRTGTSTRSLRHYERASLLTSKRQPNGYRDFDDDQVSQVETIRHLLAAGLNLATIQAIAPCYADGEIRPLCTQARAHTQATLAHLDQRAHDIDAARAALRRMLALPTGA